MHGKKAVVNFRQSASEIQWQPRNKRGASSSAETSCISFGEGYCSVRPRDLCSAQWRHFPESEAVAPGTMQSFISEICLNS